MFWRFDICETLLIVVPPIRRTRSARVSMELNVEVARSSKRRWYSKNQFNLWRRIYLWNEIRWHASDSSLSLRTMQKHQQFDRWDIRTRFLSDQWKILRCETCLFRSKSRWHLEVFRRRIRRYIWTFDSLRFANWRCDSSPSRSGRSKRPWRCTEG